MSSPKYDIHNGLNSAIQEMKANSLFTEISDFRVKGIFVKGKPPETPEITRTMKMAPPVRAVSGIDFIVMFWVDRWNQQTPDQRRVSIVHALYHITRDEKDEPALRRHGDGGADFCEIAVHDTYCIELATKIPMPQALKVGPVQTVLTADTEGHEHEENEETEEADDE